MKTDQKAGSPKDEKPGCEVPNRAVGIWLFGVAGASLLLVGFIAGRYLP